MTTTAQRFVSLRIVADRTGRHHTTLRRWWKEGLFPQPRQLGPNSIGFLESEVENWLASRPPARPAERKHFELP